ncbi:hypothetical protein AK812_SmicGene19218 [Symbiodinium microadriaticum]|uniref:Uncharacterized protein n=1 Tax=Symbiodinium microadriaticum TaxID=2951 RepID=A0A1Q9DT72_SYMMI|nr:hypothetical protein AK812_SmicGene19218 [Symbiodinium microadriaticum]
MPLQDGWQPNAAFGKAKLFDTPDFVGRGRSATLKWALANEQSKKASEKEKFAQRLKGEKLRLSEELNQEKSKSELAALL